MPSPETAWTVDSWRRKTVHQAPVYEDQEHLRQVEEKLAGYPPLVYAGEERRLKKLLGHVAEGKAFLLQGGDCAEDFSDFSANTLRDNFRVFLQMAVILTFAGRCPVVKVGRVAGQFAKPRSSATEQQGDVILPSYRGDIINGAAFDPESRKPDPDRLLEAYKQAAAKCNLLRALASGGYASLRSIQRLNMDFVTGTPASRRWRNVVDRIDESLDFMRACRGGSEDGQELYRVEFHTSHEALLLNYEQALARKDSTREDGSHVAGSAHMLWIGDRTRQPDGAHVEFLRGVVNPVGIKCGPTLEPGELLRLLGILNPGNEPGRITLILRMGAGQFREKATPLVEAVRKNGNSVVWSSDPMHGNTGTVNGLKTRRYDAIVAEATDFFRILPELGAWPGGIHLEMTGRNVTECLGGPSGPRAADLPRCYDTLCDPRLNADQSLELAFVLSGELLAARRKLGFP